VARVFVITGPSGVGKGTLIRGMMERLAGLELSVSATTRSPRTGERDGVDYHFLTPEEFDRRVAVGDFVEHADYAGRRYGTLRSELDGRLAAGVPVVLEIEVQGARQVRAAMPEAVQVFIAPPSLEALRERLTARGTDDPAEVERRLRVASQELDAQPEFRYVVVNDVLEEAIAELTTVVASELAREGYPLESGDGGAQPRGGERSRGPGGGDYT
jgi:guanylate kinase